MDELTKRKQRAIKKKLYVKQASIEEEKPSEEFQDKTNDSLDIKAVSFKSRSHQLIDNYNSLSQPNLKPQRPWMKLIGIAAAIVIMATIVYLLFAANHKKQTTSITQPSVSTVDEAIYDFSTTSSVVLAASQEVDMEILNLELKENNLSSSEEELVGNDEKKVLTNKQKIAELTGTKTGWNASFQSLEDLHTTQERSLVMLPAWLINAGKEARCFENGSSRCLPKNILDSNKRVCIKTFFPNGRTETSEVIGYFGNVSAKNIKTLSFDEYTAKRQKIKKQGVINGVSWKVVACD